MLGEKFGHFCLNRLRQQGARPVTQHLGERIGERPWLKQLHHVSIGHGVSLLCWRSGGSNTPTIRRLLPVSPSPTSAHSSQKNAAPGLGGAAAERYGATPSSAGGPMPYRFNEPHRHKIPRARYRVQNWPEYDRALQRRGELTVWVTPEAIAAWCPPRTGRRGRPRDYSDVAIETGHLLRLAFGRPWRHT